MSIGLSILGAVFDKSGDDSSVMTVAELAMLAKMIGAPDAPAQPAASTGKIPDHPADDLAGLLGR